DTLLDRLFDAARWYQARSIGIAGGVSANSRLRADVEERGRAKGIPVFVPDLALATDNAAMIAAAGLRRLRGAGVEPHIEDNADAHLKRTIMGHQVMLPITAGKLDLGPWEQMFYAEFDGQRRKRVIVKVMGE